MKSCLRHTQRKPLLYPFYCKLKFCSFFRLILQETSGALAPLEQLPSGDFVLFGCERAG